MDEREIPTVVPLSGARKKRYPIAKAKAYDPNMFGLGEHLEKSSGHPLLDKVRTAFRQFGEAEAAAEQFAAMDAAIASDPSEVRMNLYLTTVSEEMTEEEMLEAALTDNPELRDAYYNDPNLQEQVKQEMIQILTNGQNRMERSFQLEIPIPLSTAKTIVQQCRHHIPNPNPNYVADILRAAATELDGRE